MPAVTFVVHQLLPQANNGPITAAQLSMDQWKQVMMQANLMRGYLPTPEGPKPASEQVVSAPHSRPTLPKTRIGNAGCFAHCVSHLCTLLACIMFVCDTMLSFTIIFIQLRSKSLKPEPSISVCLQHVYGWPFLMKEQTKQPEHFTIIQNPITNMLHALQ